MASTIEPPGRAIDEVADELIRALHRHAPMASAHEGYAVILEELDELWAEVKKRSDRRSRSAMRAEACQVAAMAIRFMLEVTPPESAHA